MACKRCSCSLVLVVVGWFQIFALDLMLFLARQFICKAMIVKMPRLFLKFSFILIFYLGCEMRF